MKSIHYTTAILLGASILVAAPLSSASSASGNRTVAAVDDAADKLNKLPSGAKRIVTKASEYFGLTSVKIITEGYHPESWKLVIENQTEPGQKNASVPTSIHMTISGKNSSVLQLDTYWDQKKNTPAPNKSEALKKAAGFTDQLFGQSMIAANDAVLETNDFFTVNLYPTKDGIPVQKAVATVTVDPFGRILSFKRLSADVDLQKLPAATGLLSTEQLKQHLGKELQVELVFDAEKNLFQYVPVYPSGFDAKTGEALFPPYDYKEEITTLPFAGQASKALTSEAVKQMGISFLGLNKEKLTLSASRESIPGSLPKRTYTLQDGTREVVVKVDEKSDTLLSVSEWNGNREQSPSVTSREDAKQRALLFISSYVPIAADHYVVQERYVSEKLPGWVQKKSLPTHLELAIYPIHGEIRAAVPYVTATIDLNHSIMTSVETSIYPMPTAATPAVIAKAEAIKVLASALEVEPSYVYPSYFGQQSPSPQLVYLPTNAMKQIAVDATSGVLIRPN